MQRRAQITLRSQVEYRGIAVPLRADAVGRIADESGEAQDRSLLRRAFSDNENDNPWRQGLSFGIRAVLRVSDRATVSLIRAQAERIFRDHFPGRFSLDDVAQIDANGQGQLRVRVRYRRRVTGEIDAIDVPAGV